MSGNVVRLALAAGAVSHGIVGSTASNLFN